MTPDIAEIRPIWDALGAKHERFHKYGEKVLDALHTGDYAAAEKLYEEARDYSRELISDLEQMIRIAES